MTDRVDPADMPGGPDEVWHLRLYVAGQSPKSLQAFANLKTLCEEHLPTPLRRIIGDLSNTERVLVGLRIDEGAVG